MDALDLPQVTLAGHFIGGWLAAEMAVMSPRTFDRLILIDAAGIQPQDGEIADVFLHGQEGTRQLAYFDPQQVAEYAELFQGKPSKEERDIQTRNQETLGPLLLEAVYVQPQPAGTVRPGASANADYLGGRTIGSYRWNAARCISTRCPTLAWRLFRNAATVRHWKSQLNVSNSYAIF